jgi:uncharacterized damage-inducible protein DinB
LTPELVASIERFANAIGQMDARELETALPDPPDADSRWQSFAEYPREMIFVAYQRLCDLAARTASQRATSHPQSIAQRILGQHQLAFRDLTGALVGVPDDMLDRKPAPGEYSIRETLSHMMMAESGFRIAIEWALEQRDSPSLSPDQFDSRDALIRSRDMFPFDGDLASFRVTFAHVHGLALEAFSSLPDADLVLPMVWWEGVMPIRDILLFFNAHMREHTIQVDKTILGIGLTVTEGARLARLLHRALGECEAAVIGAPATTTQLHHDIEAQFALWNRVVEGARFAAIEQ